MDFSAILQQFGFPVALAVALVYWWRRDYSDLVQRLRSVEDRAKQDQREYANSYKVLAEQVTEALEQNNRVTRQLLASLGEKVYERSTERAARQTQEQPGSKSDRHRTPLPFCAEDRA